MNELTPYLCVGDARAAMGWYADVFGAEVTAGPIVMDDGRIGHVEMVVDDARWMMADPFPDIGVEAPDPGRGAAVTLHLEVPDVDALTAKVTGSGIALDRGPEDSPHGRVAVFRDPFGHRWLVNQPDA
ncbi:MAG: VOC family protein [Haloechinothrix sp.]